MGEELFREKAVKRASSPEQLNEYIKVTNPGVWVTLAAIIILLVGVCVWGTLGRIETTVNAVAISDGSTTVCYLVESDSLSSVKNGQQVQIGDNVYYIDSVSAEALQVKDCIALAKSERAKYLGGFSDTDWVYEVTLKSTDTSIDIGTYSAKIVTESVSPMSFIFN
jgi:hypothetical protein